MVDFNPMRFKEKFTELSDSLKNAYKYSKVCLKKFIRWVLRQEVILYILTFFIALFGTIMVNIGMFTKDILGYILFIFLFIAVLSDLINIYLKYKEKAFGKFLLLLYSILVYFLLIQAESIGYSVITETTGEKADYFPVVSNFFQGIFIPIAFILLIFKNFIFIVVIFSLAIFLTLFTIISPKEFKQISIHIGLFSFSIFILFLFSATSNIDKKYESFFGENYIPKKIVEYSYYKNTNCKDVEGYIHFLYKDMISVSNVKDLNYTNGVTVNFVDNNDTNITFSTQKCIRKEKVDLKERI